MSAKPGKNTAEGPPPTRQGFPGPIRGETPGKGNFPLPIRRSLAQKRRPRAGAAVPPPVRRATTGTLPPARRAQKRGGDAAAPQQHGRTAPVEDRGEIQGGATHRRRRR
uniref:Uncharacterized protein n=1 Tax=Oryza rufipogon TaxID=4529 RepID=A0A0E0P5A4_ORYRU